MKKAFERLKFFVCSPVFPVILMTFAFFPSSWHELIIRWENPDDPFSHGWLIATISCGLLFMAVVRLDHSQCKPNLLALLPLAGLSIAINTAMLISIQSLQMALLPLIIVFALLAILGWQLTRPLFFSVLFLYFAIPVWIPMVAVLQYFTTQVNGFLIGLGGISFTIDGNFISLPNGTFEVADGCSGLKYFLTSLSLGCLYGYWFIKDIKSKLIMAGTAIVLAMLANWIRVFVIILVGYSTNMQHELIRDHNSFGWVVYCISLIPFYILGNRLTRNTVESQHPVSSLGSIAFKASVAPLLILVSLFGVIAISTEYLKQNAKIIEIPFPIKNQLNPISAANLWHPVVLDSSENIEGTYANGSFRSPVSVYHFKFQQPWINEIRDYRDDYFPQPWNVTESEIVVSRSGDRFLFSELESTNTRRHQLVVYWYTVGNYKTESPIKAKLMQAAQLSKGNYGSTLTFVGMSCLRNCANKKKILQEFASTLAQDMTFQKTTKFWQ